VFFFFSSRNLVATIDALAKDPETLAAVQALLVQLLAEPHTHAAFLGLLHATFEDEGLRAAAGEFLVKSLEVSLWLCKLPRLTFK
jgi:hypothetical protein